MTSETWPASPVLVRRYRRLLLAYPRDYRRRQGAEILTTLMDGAGPDRERPTAAEIRDVVAGGLRQRFRLPVGRLVVLVAIMTALSAGGLGAGAGSAIGWATAQRPPTDAAFGELARQALGTPPAPQHVTHAREALGISWQVMAAGPAGEQSPERVRSRLEAAGWRVDPPRPGRSQVWLSGPDGVIEVPLDVVDILAERDGIALDVTIATQRSGRPDLDHLNGADLTATPAEPAAAVPLTAAGALLGLLAGWLLTARIGYRLRRCAPEWRVPLATVAIGAVLLLGRSTLASWVYAVVSVAPRAAFDWLRPAPPFVVFVPPDLLVIPASILAATVLLLAFTVRSRPARAPALDR
jgi:hypothetical protein